MKELLPHEAALLEMLKVVLWNKEFDTSVMVGDKQQLWSQILNLAQRQALLGVLIDVLEKVPQELHPNSNTKLRWAANADAIERRYTQQEEACAQLVGEYQKEGIDMLVIKGMGLARLYPNPRRRECGDIDFFLFGEYDRGNKIAAALGAKMHHEMQLHYDFEYLGCTFENHSSITGVHNSEEEVIEGGLKPFLNVESSIAHKIGKDNITIYFPHPTFNAIHVARHTHRHIAGSITLRHIIDLALTLAKTDYDKDAFVEVMDKAYHTESVSALVSICIKYFGMPAEKNPFSVTVNQKIEDYLAFDVLLREKGIRHSKNPIVNTYYRLVRSYHKKKKMSFSYHIKLSTLIWRGVKKQLTK